MEWVRGEREMYNDSHLFAMDTETTKSYMALLNGHDESILRVIMTTIRTELIYHSLSVSLRCHPYLHLRLQSCKHALRNEHAHLHASPCLQNQHEQICMLRSFPHSLQHRFLPPSLTHSDKFTQIQGDLPPLLF